MFKKLSIVLSIFLCLFMLVSCEEEVTYKVEFEKEEVSIYVGEETDLSVIVVDPETRTTNKNVQIDVEVDVLDVIKVENGKIVALKAGEATITCEVKELNIKATMKVIVTEKPAILVNEINITGENTMIVGKTQNLSVEVLPSDSEKKEVVWSSSDESIATVNNGLVTAIAEGKVVISCQSTDGSEIKKDFMIEVTKTLVTKIEISGKNQIEINEVVNFTCTVSPSDANNPEVTWTTSDENIVTVEDGVVTGVASGTAIITVTANDGSGVSREYTVVVLKDSIKPEIIIDETVTTKDVSISYNTDFDPALGVKAIDNIDGDITSKMRITSDINKHIAGKYTVTYKVKDSANNTTTFTREVTVVWNSSVAFIGHAGCYSGIMNTEEAFIKAASVHGYQAIECDIKQTSDGVFVTCHDDTFGGLALASTTYDAIKDVQVTQTRGGISYTSKICTFERYLQICKMYNVKAVVELKWSNGINNNDTSRMQALLDVIEECDMLNDVIFLASQYKCLEWTRANGYDYIPCQYLVNSADSETVFNRCVENNFDVSFNITSVNTQEWIDRYHEAGLLVSCYTFSQYTTTSDLQKWIDMRVDYVTVDVIKPYEVKLPMVDETVKPTYTVKFVDWNDEVIKEAITKEGANAISPIDPDRLGYTFTGWDTDFSNVTSDLTVKAEYTMDTYSIVYNDALKIISEESWTTKEEFVNELYTDWFNWLDSKVGVIPGLTKDSNGYTFSLSDKTAKWSSVSELLALDPYDVERTIGAYAYKPVTRPSSTTPVDPVADENYFLNTEPYRTKYMYMDGYLLNCMNESYSGYDKNFAQASNGRVQIFFRFHQWCKGTKIASLDNYPVKCLITEITGVEVTLPTTPSNYTVVDAFDLPTPIVTGAEFDGWYTDSTLTNKIEKIEAGSTGDLYLYAKWIISEEA